LTRSSSSPAGLPPKARVEPPLLTVVQGNPAVLKAETTGSSPFTYVWAHDGVVLPGAQSASLILPQTTESDIGTYSVLVRNDYGESLAEGRLGLMLPLPDSELRWSWRASRAR